MNKKFVKVARIGLGLAVGIGAGAIVSAAIKGVTPLAPNKVMKALTWVGGLALGGMVTDMAVTHATGQFDTVVDYIEKFTEEPEPA